MCEKHELKQYSDIGQVHRPLPCSQIQNTGINLFIEKNVNNLIPKKTNESRRICSKSNIQKNTSLLMSITE